MNVLGKAGQGKARQGRAGQGRAGQARHGRARQGKARQGKAKRDRTTRESTVVVQDPCCQLQNASQWVDVDSDVWQYACNWAGELGSEIW